MSKLYCNKATAHIIDEVSPRESWFPNCQWNADNWLFKIGTLKIEITRKWIFSWKLANSNCQTVLSVLLIASYGLFHAISSKKWCNIETRKTRKWNWMQSKFCTFMSVGGWSILLYPCLCSVLGNWSGICQQEGAFPSKSTQKTFTRHFLKQFVFSHLLPTPPFLS